MGVSFLKKEPYESLPCGSGDRYLPAKKLIIPKLQEERDGDDITGSMMREDLASFHQSDEDSEDTYSDQSD